MRRERLGHRDQSGAQDPPGEGPPPNGAHELRSADAPSAGGRHSQGAVLVGGSGGALHVTFCPGGGAETAPRRPVPQRSSSTLAGQDHRRALPSGL